MRHARQRRSLDDRLLAGRHGRLIAAAFAMLLGLVAMVSCVAALTLAAPTLLRVALGVGGTWGLVVALLATRAQLLQRRVG